MADPDIDPSDHTVEELPDEIESIDDPETLREIHEIEADTQDRKGAKETIENRLEELENDTDGDEPSISLVEIQTHIRDHAPDLINCPLDGIIEVERNEDGGRAVAEFVERRSVPDTQDIIGQYEILLETNCQIHSYRRLNRYRRGDTNELE